MSDYYDVIIVGGGIIGISLALVLAKASFKIALVEAGSTSAQPPNPFDDRTIVLAHSGRTIFESFDAWQPLQEQACPIREIHVSDKGHFGSSRLRASDEKLSALGYVASAGAIATVLQAALKSEPNISLFQPAKFQSYCYHSDRVEATFLAEQGTFTLIGKLLVASDGQYSAVRNYIGIKVKTHEYNQVAIICNVSLKRDHECTAYERFTDQGPLAMLPLMGQASAVIWTVSQTEAKRLLALSEEDFRETLQKSFGYRLGKLLHCSRPGAINLQQAMALQQILPGVVLLGNAAHTLHPVAGQGLNLGLRDLAVLAEELVAANSKGQVLGDISVLQRYLNRRQKDQQQIITFTHSLVGLFSNSLLPLVLARNTGMVLLDRINGIKKILTKKALGLSGKVPRLACGMPLE